MWFHSAEYGGLYWVTRSDERHFAERPRSAPDAVPTRDPVEGDWEYDNFRTRIGGVYVEVRWICNDEFVQQQQPTATLGVKFPKNPNVQTLAEIFKLGGKKVEAVALSPHAVLTTNKDNSSFILHINSQKALSWRENLVFWNFTGLLTPLQVEIVKQYLGENWMLSERYGMASLVNQQGKWVLASGEAMLTSDGKILNEAEFQETFQRQWLTKYEKLVQTIVKYTNLITPERIKEIAADMTSKTHCITTRCSGCQHCQAMHLFIHMARNDLDPYLIYSAYDAFGADEFGGAVRQVWDLLADPSIGNVLKFRKIMYQFLLSNLRGHIIGPTFMPMPKRKDANAWTLWNKTRFRIIDGIRMEPFGQENVDRLGGILFRERNAEVSPAFGQWDAVNHDAPMINEWEN